MTSDGSGMERGWMLCRERDLALVGKQKKWKEKLRNKFGKPSRGVKTETD